MCLFGYSSLNNLNDFIARLEGVILCKDVTYILHASLDAFGHKTKHPVEEKKPQMRLDLKWQKLKFFTSR